MRSTIGTKFLRTLIAAGYLLMCLLAVGIMYLWFYEWKEIEALETENRRINAFRQEVHLVYGEMTGLSLLGESVLEWEVGVTSPGIPKNPLPAPKERRATFPND